MKPAIHREIGGYPECESFGALPYHKDAIQINSGRNALKYIIQAYDIKKLYVPRYTCPVVCDAAQEEGCELKFYEIDKTLMPAQDFPDNAYILCNDYFGVCNDNVTQLAKRYKNLIVDNAQSFYASPKGLASFYSPRKFFGLPDGGLLICDKQLPIALKNDISYERATHLYKRLELGANAAYNDFKRNENSLAGQPILKMSKLTQSLMGNINYTSVHERRLKNFEYLHKSLKSINELTFSGITCPMVYPLLIKRNGIREKLISNGIYVAHYWPDAKDNTLSNYLLPLPIDQRYNESDMQHIIKVISEVF